MNPMRTVTIRFACTTTRGWDSRFEKNLECGRRYQFRLNFKSESGKGWKSNGLQPGNPEVLEDGAGI
jgi:hypothetical protein